MERKNREEAARLEREREKLRAEREKIERERAELIRFEREAQRLERERLMKVGAWLVDENVFLFIYLFHNQDQNDYRIKYN